MPASCGDVPEPENVFLKMKEQIDSLEHTLKDRTNEMREIQKFIKRLEVNIIESSEKNFDQAYKKIDYNHADLKDLMFQRMNLVSKKLVANNKVIANNKEAGQAENIATKKKVKMFGRKVDMRMDEVNADHDKLTGKYDYLIHCNDYFAKLAEQIITVTELNTSLLHADERDKNSISLLGTTGPKTLQNR